MVERLMVWINAYRKEGFNIASPFIKNCIQNDLAEDGLDFELEDFNRTYKLALETLEGSEGA